MSEQFAIQPEEFDSTNERLDSILDRLNSLGQSAAEMKAAPLRPLQSVPDLGDDIAPDVDVVETPVLVPPAIPQLGLVPPAIPTSEEVFEVEDTEIADTEASAAALGSLDTVDLGADFESVTAIEADVELDADVELAPHDLEAPEVGGVVVANEAPVLDVAGHVTDDDIALAEAADSEAIAAEVDEFADFEAEVISPEIAVPEADVEVPVAEIFEPAAEERAVAETIAEPVTADPFQEETGENDVLDTGITAPHSIFDRVAPATIGQAAPTVEEVAPEPQVFEFDAPVETAPSLPERPEAPTSIFSSSIGRDDNKTSQQSPVPETDGWISHNVLEPEFVAADSATPEVEIAPPVTPSFFDQDEVVTPEPPIAPVELAVAPADPQALASEVEQTLVEIDQLEAVDPFSADAPETSFVIAGIDPPVTDYAPSSFDALETGVAASEPVALYDSDDELPLPDFTGVYDESPEASEAAKSPKVARASVRDKELDKLRPEEDDLDTLMIEEDLSKGAGWSPLLQLIFVIGFGVAVLVFFWLQDPTAVADMRNELDALLGRN